jgi:carbamoyltransferase
MDLAASLQELTNRLMHGLVAYWMKETSHRNLCMAGGVALNCVANEKILKVAEVQDFFIQPAAGDDGSALGAALEVAARRGQRFERMNMPCWGPAYSAQDLATVYDGILLESVIKRNHLDPQQAAVRIAHLLAEGKIVALFQGTMEFGPRALGNRSILADPRDPAMRDRVNLAVKMRERFRPFAPAVLPERIDDFFSVTKFRKFPYMLVTVPVKDTWRGSLPAVTHVDGSARVQTVSKDDNPLFYSVLEAFGNLTGIPIVLNTSFNVKGEPIVCTPQQAVETFLRTGIDSLFLQNYELTKLPSGSCGYAQVSTDN